MLLLAGGARAQAQSFGASGQAAFTMTSQGDFPFSFSKTGGGDWSLHLVPSLDYFIQEHLSVGGLIGLDTDGGGSTIRFGARVGYDVPLGALVSMWPRGGLQVAHMSPKDSPGVNVTTLGFELPFLFHFVPHILLGVGPFISVPLTNSAAMSSKDPTYGLTALVGGYF